MRKPRYLNQESKAKAKRAKEIIDRLAEQDGWSKQLGLPVPVQYTLQEWEHLYPLGLGRKLNAKIMAGRIKTLD